jgi:hypothetical protein
MAELVRSVLEFEVPAGLSTDNLVAFVWEYVEDTNPDIDYWKLHGINSTKRVPPRTSKRMSMIQVTTRVEENDRGSIS